MIEFIIMFGRRKNRNSTGNKFANDALANILDMLTIEISKCIESLKESLIQNLVQENKNKNELIC